MDYGCTASRRLWVGGLDTESDPLRARKPSIDPCNSPYYRRTDTLNQYDIVRTSIRIDGPIEVQFTDMNHWEEGDFDWRDRRLEADSCRPQAKNG